MIQDSSRPPEQGLRNIHSKLPHLPAENAGMGKEPGGSATMGGSSSFGIRLRGRMLISLWIHGTREPRLDGAQEPFPSLPI
jgi:hypothetical protein